jgi:endogenous inhibitor of DNA gyrase (YacG/DUF329 family)
MKKNWTSKKQKSITHERRDHLDMLAEFTNADFNNGSSNHLIRQFADLLNLMLVQHRETHPYIMSAEKTEIMQGLQKHLRSRFNKIIHNTILLVEMPLWTVRGSLKLTVDKENHFYERFRFLKVKEENELKAMKKLIDLALVEIIRDLDFKPRRFHQCPKCKSYFYQPTEKERIFCSTKCGDAVRLQKFRKEKKKLQKRLSDESDKKQETGSIPKNVTASGFQPRATLPKLPTKKTP